MNPSALDAPGFYDPSGSQPSAARKLSRRSTFRHRADLDDLPALMVLERLPVPVLAVETRGAAVFANTAFADLLGYQKSSVLATNLRQILLGLTLDEFVLPFLHARAGCAVNLIHAECWVIQTQMSASAPQGHDDQVMLLAFLALPTTGNRWNQTAPTTS